MLNSIKANINNPSPKFLMILISLVISLSNQTDAIAQIQWKNISNQFGKLPETIRILKTDELLEGFPSVMFVAEINVKDKSLDLSIDTTSKRRLTPSQYHERNQQPFVVVNCSFFEFVQNRNVNLIVQNSKIVGYDTPAVSRKGRDTLTYIHTLGSAFGIFKNRKMDIAYNYNDSSINVPFVLQSPYEPKIDSNRKMSISDPSLAGLKKWKVFQAFGGGPVLVLDGKINITNNEERKFAGKAISDKHPRTAIGYTNDGRLIILAIQGRMKGLAEGATLPQMAKIMVDLGCVEAMNLDGGGSSCLLINGKETIKPSDPNGQRPVPAVFIVK